MDILDQALERLAASDACGYHAGSAAAMEPTALAALALMAHGRADRAAKHLDWLVAVQGADGSVGVEEGQATPGWPTAWAIIAWQAAAKAVSPNPRYTAACQRGVGWLLNIQGSQIEYLDKSGHDTTIIGWPWVDGTHSWIEPTAISLLALRHANMAGHPRAREGPRCSWTACSPRAAATMATRWSSARGSCRIFGRRVWRCWRLAGRANRRAAWTEPLNICEASCRPPRRPRHCATDCSGWRLTTALPAKLGSGCDGRGGRWPATRRVTSWRCVSLAALGTSCPLIPSEARWKEPGPMSELLTDIQSPLRRRSGSSTVARC